MLRCANSVSFLGLSPPKACKIVCYFLPFQRGAKPSGILFLVSIERGGSRRVYDRGTLLSDVSQLGDAPCRCLARPSGSAHRCRRTEACQSADGTVLSHPPRTERVLSRLFLMRRVYGTEDRKAFWHRMKTGPVPENEGSVRLRCCR